MKNLLQAVIMAALTLPGIVAAAEQDTPRVLMIAQNQGTEITDLLVPFAVLSRAGIEVTVVATEPGKVELWPAFNLVNLPLLQDVDVSDYDLLLVPAVLQPAEQGLQSFLRRFVDHGGLVASTCDGVNVLAESGLLDGHRATGHFYSHKSRVKNYPDVAWVQDIRYLEDTPFITTAGVSASAPAAVYLVQRLLNEQAANRVGSYYGIDADPGHSVDDYRFGLGNGLAMLSNGIRGMAKRTYTIDGNNAVDELALALTVDILGRTSRIKFGLAAGVDEGFGAGEDTVRTRYGLELQTVDFDRSDVWIELPGKTTTKELKPHAAPEVITVATPDRVLDAVLGHVETEFGRGTMRTITKQLELPWP